MYRSKMGKAIFKTKQIPAYYSLYTMILVSSMLLTILLNLPVTLLTGQILGISINWLKWAGGLMFGVLAGMAIGMAISMMYCIAFNIATGTTLGLTNGMFASVATGVWVAATAGLGVGTMTGKNLRHTDRYSCRGGNRYRLSRDVQSESGNNCWYSGVAWLVVFIIGMMIELLNIVVVGHRIWGGRWLDRRSSSQCHNWYNV